MKFQAGLSCCGSGPHWNKLKWLLNLLNYELLLQKKQNYTKSPKKPLQWTGLLYKDICWWHTLERPAHAEAGEQIALTRLGYMTTCCRRPMQGPIQPATERDATKLSGPATNKSAPFLKVHSPHRQGGWILLWSEIQFACYSFPKGNQFSKLLQCGTNCFAILILYNFFKIQYILYIFISM